jgi:protoporphyrin/coproporphyrin ferrochelatase
MPPATSSPASRPGSQAVLLVNLGSPDSPAVPDVRRYLREFLMDERVIDLSYQKRWLLVHLLILPFRPRRTAAAYRKIWWPDGAPLVVITQRVCQALRRRLPVPVEMAMRYQNPSIEKAIQSLISKSIQELVVIPLYPQYALSSYETVVVKVEETVRKLAPNLQVKYVPPFYNDPNFIDAWVASAQRFIQRDFDHLLFSFHGLPERHLRKSDPTGRHCLQTDSCCQTPSPAHDRCYRAQAFAMVKAFVERTQVPESKYSVSFQSRLGRDPWLRPYTDHVIAELPARGVRRLIVTCPAFVSDCLETLEEIGLRGWETFEQAGGTQLELVPCLNAHPDWISALEKMALRYLGVPAQAKLV